MHQTCHKLRQVPPNCQVQATKTFWASGRKVSARSCCEVQKLHSQGALADALISCAIKITKSRIKHGGKHCDNTVAITNFDDDDDNHYYCCCYYYSYYNKHNAWINNFRPSGKGRRLAWPGSWHENTMMLMLRMWMLSVLLPVATCRRWLGGRGKFHAIGDSSPPNTLLRQKGLQPAETSFRDNLDDTTDTHISKANHDISNRITCINPRMESIWEDH